jgi:RNA polymerase sigma-70 factor (ECF subfamily)
VARLRLADRAAAEELFNASYPRLAGWVRRLVDDDETAHEIASEAFTRLLARWSGLESPHSYLYMIATNLVRDHWRKDRPGAQGDRDHDRGCAARPFVPPSAGRRRPDADRGAAGTAAQPFLLHYYGGFGVREVAAMLGKPEGTIKADLYHARSKLKSAIGSAGD